MQSTKTVGLTTDQNSDILARLKTMIKAAPPRQSIKKTIEDDITNDAFPSSPLPNNKTHDVVYSIVEASPKGLAYTDLTGRFSYRSSRGNEYIFVGFHADANAILVETDKVLASRLHGRK